MKNTLRCCISCILPCGALDVVRIVHTNGRVEELSGTVKAEEIMKLHPKHVLKKPSSAPPSEGVCPKIVVVPPDAELQRGKIYFLMAAPPPPAAAPAKIRSTKLTKRKKKDGGGGGGGDHNTMSDVLISDRYLSEILSTEKVSSRRRGRVGVWRPHLESISEADLA